MKEEKNEIIIFENQGVKLEVSLSEETVWLTQRQMAELFGKDENTINEHINNIFVPIGFSNFKIEGRGLGSAILLEFLLYYLTKPEFYLHVREAVYLDNMLDLF